MEDKPHYKEPDPAFNEETSVAPPRCITTQGAASMKRSSSPKKSGKPYGMDNRQVSGHLNPADITCKTGGGPNMPPMSAGKRSRGEK